MIGVVVIDAWLVAMVWSISAAVEDVLLERGILGVLVLVLGTFSWRTIQAQGKRLEAAETRERQLQAEIYTKTLPILERIGQAADRRATIDEEILGCLQANTEVLTDVRRQLERGP